MFRIPDEHDEALLAGLGARPEWAALRRIGQERMERHFLKLAKAFATEGKEPDYERLQWQRGFFAGMKFLLDCPTVEANKLERLLERLENNPDDEVTELA